MVARVPSQSSVYAQEGTAAHVVAQALAEGAQRAIAPANQRSTWIGKSLEGGFICDDEMFEAAAMYAADISAVMQSTNIFGGENTGSETQVDISVIFPGMQGTVDYWLYSKDTHTLYVWDFKYGRSLVEVFENLQLVLYVIG